MGRLAVHCCDLHLSCARRPRRFWRTTGALSHPHPSPRSPSCTVSTGVRWQADLAPPRRRVGMCRRCCFQPSCVSACASWLMRGPTAAEYGATTRSPQVRPRSISHRRCPTMAHLYEPFETLSNGTRTPRRRPPVSRGAGADGLELGDREHQPGGA